MDAYLVKGIYHFCNISLKKSTPFLPTKINYYDLTLVLGGEITYYADGRRIDLRENDAMLLPPGTVRSRDPIPDPSKYVCFNFYLADGKELSLPEYMPGIINTDIKKIISGFTSHHILPTGHSKEQVIMVLNYVLYELINLYEQKSRNEYVIRAIEYINCHLTESITLRAVSEHLKLSKEYTSALFKKETGVCLTEYVTERKMLLAKQMLDSNEQSSLTEVAKSLGYDNYYYFSRLFKRKFGIAPIKFKKECRQ